MSAASQFTNNYNIFAKGLEDMVGKLKETAETVIAAKETELVALRARLEHVEASLAEKEAYISGIQASNLEITETLKRASVFLDESKKLQEIVTRLVENVTTSTVHYPELKPFIDPGVWARACQDAQQYAEVPTAPAVASVATPEDKDLLLDLPGPPLDSEAELSHWAALDAPSTAAASAPIIFTKQAATTTVASASASVSSRDRKRKHEEGKDPRRRSSVRAKLS